MDQVNTLEAFIEKLHGEGVEAGLHEAEQLRAAATAEGAAIIDEARKTAQQLIAQAEARAKAILSETESELALAVRDVQLELRVRLEDTLTRLLEEGLRHDLEDPELLTRLLVEIVRAYARADGERQTLEVKVPAELVGKLAEAVPAVLGRALADGTEVDLKAGPSSAGFEYRVRDAVVEVTPQSVAQKLGELVSTQLREVLRSMGGKQSAATR